MVFFILLFCCILFLITRILKRFGKSNILLNTFLYIWIIIFIFLIFFNPQSFKFLTDEGVTIIFAHLIAMASGVFFYPKQNFQLKQFPFRIKLSVATLFYTFLILSLAGLYLFSNSVNFLDAIRLNQIARLRESVLLKEVEVSPLTVLLTNFLYPLACITPIYTLKDKKRILLLFFVVVLFFIYSLSSGGKGGIILMNGTLTGAIFYLVKTKQIKFDKTLKTVAVIVSIAILLIFAWITYSRMSYTGMSAASSTIDMIVTYFSTSVPAFCQLLQKYGYDLINFDLSQHNLIRNIGSIAGIKFTWKMESIIVNVPEPFNVFSSIADSIISLGLFGSLFYYFAIGLMMGWANNIKEMKGIFIFSIFFLFSLYSFFVDIFYFMAGSWFCVFSYLFIDIKNSKKDVG